MFTVQVAEAGFKTLGYIYYEVIIPKGYTFEILSGMTYVSLTITLWYPITHYTTRYKLYYPLITD